MLSPAPARKTFNPWLILRLCTFQIGSAMGDILVTSIWNRILITNFGIPATPVGLLIALRYLLSPVSLWAGFRSDTRPLFGFQRTTYIWLGRAMMVASLPLLGFSVVRLGADQGSIAGWGLALTSSLLYGAGTLVSGSPYLALVRDSAPPNRQGLAIGLAETVLITFFAIAGYTFSRWMEVYDLAVFWQMIIATMAVGGFFWFAAIVGVERRVRPEHAATGSVEREIASPGFLDTFGRIWQDGRTRRFFLFLSLATMAAWAQDAILEPFGAEALQLEMGSTTRFNSYWQGATVLTLVAGAIIWRRRPPERQTAVAKGGLLVMTVGMALLGASSLLSSTPLALAALVLFGGGFGVYTFGGLSLMAVMSADLAAGAYLGLWTLAILISKGVGTSLGGILRDGLLGLGLSPGISYGTIFFLEAAGLLAAALILTDRDVLDFARDYDRGRSSAWETAVAASD